MIASDPEHECEFCRVSSPDSERAKVFFAAVEREEEERHEAWMDSFWTTDDAPESVGTPPRTPPTDRSRNER